MHWVIATNEQVGAGIRNAVDRVKARGAIVEGNSFVEYVRPDVFIMVARADDLKSKASARRALSNVSAYYFSGDIAPDAEELGSALRHLHPNRASGDIPVFTRRSLVELATLLQGLTAEKTIRVSGKPS